MDLLRGKTAVVVADHQLAGVVEQAQGGIQSALSDERSADDVTGIELYLEPVAIGRRVDPTTDEHVFVLPVRDRSRLRPRVVGLNFADADGKQTARFELLNAGVHDLLL